MGKQLNQILMIGALAGAGYVLYTMVMGASSSTSTATATSGLEGPYRRQRPWRRLPPPGGGGGYGQWGGGGQGGDQFGDSGPPIGGENIVYSPTDYAIFGDE